MRKTVTIALLALLSILTGRAGSQHAEAFMPTDLRCEYLVNPLGIDSRVPRLSWKLESGNLKLETRSVAEIARGVRQRANQI